MESPQLPAEARRRRQRTFVADIVSAPQCSTHPSTHRTDRQSPLDKGREPHCPMRCLLRPLPPPLPFVDCARWIQGKKWLLGQLLHHRKGRHGRRRLPRRRDGPVRWACFDPGSMCSPPRWIDRLSRLFHQPKRRADNDNNENENIATQ